ncbi:hypothetical protein SAMCFNEI73_pC2019 (plasmid) [Sinorhizobium americanum]|uniref:Uncharacterized protein n=1 Tax=Sinorhizobium americanum TaxID=194963 RepID=A0A1L3M035_9HYPH|nr:hypothetical protein SAMCFNEI73_pC2019 [Sinorhizobium americanum]
MVLTRKGFGKDRLRFDGSRETIPQSDFAKMESKWTGTT